MPSCPHGRRRSRCKDCGGCSICEHGRVRYQCKECGGKGICEHGRRRYRCKECASRCVEVEATVVTSAELAADDELVCVPYTVLPASAVSVKRKRQQ